MTVANDLFLLFCLIDKLKQILMWRLKTLKVQKASSKNKIGTSPQQMRKLQKVYLCGIELTNVFVTNFAAAAGIINILKTKIIPTVCNDPTIAMDNKIRNK